MSLSEIQKERNEQCRERHELAVNRIRSMVTEETVEKAYVGYFQDVALFLLELENTRRKVASGEWENYTLEQMRSLNEILYSDILDKNYERSYANPEYAVSSLEQKWDNCSVYFMQNCGAASLMRLRRRQTI